MSKTPPLSVRKAAEMLLKDIARRRIRQRIGRFRGERQLWKALKEEDMEAFLEEAQHHPDPGEGTT